MKYEFRKKIIDTTKREYYMVKAEGAFSIIENFEFTKENQNEVQEIIKAINESKTLAIGDEYYWGNEDIDLFANENGVLLIDELAQRGGEYDPDKITLRLTHEDIISFLESFKKFIEENS